MTYTSRTVEEWGDAVKAASNPAAISVKAVRGGPVGDATSRDASPSHHIL